MERSFLDSSLGDQMRILADDGNRERQAGEASSVVSATTHTHMHSQHPEPSESQLEWPRSALATMTDSPPAQPVWNGPEPGLGMGAGVSGAGIRTVAGPGGLSQFTVSQPDWHSHPASHRPQPGFEQLNLMNFNLAQNPTQPRFDPHPSESPVQLPGQDQLYPCPTTINGYSLSHSFDHGHLIPTPTPAPTPIPVHHSLESSLPFLRANQPVLPHQPQLNHPHLNPPLPLLRPQSFSSLPISNQLHSAYLGDPEMPDLLATRSVPVPHHVHPAPPQSWPPPVAGNLDPCPMAAPVHTQPLSPPTSTRPPHGGSQHIRPRRPFASQPLLRAQHALNHPHIDVLQMPSHHSTHIHPAPTEQHYPAHGQVGLHHTHFLPSQDLSLMATPQTSGWATQHTHQILPQQHGHIQHPMMSSCHLQAKSNSPKLVPQAPQIPDHIIHSSNDLAFVQSEMSKPGAEPSLMGPPISRNLAHQMDPELPQSVPSPQMNILDCFPMAKDQAAVESDPPKLAAKHVLMGPHVLAVTSPGHHVGTEQPQPVSEQPLLVPDPPLPVISQPDRPVAADCPHQMPAVDPQPSPVGHTLVDPAQLAPETQPTSALPPDLPPSVTLLHLAHLHVHAAHLLVPSLMACPPGDYALLGMLHYQPVPGNGTMHTHAVATYCHHIMAAMAALRATVYLDGAPAEHALTALCELVVLLLSETQPSAEPAVLVRHGLVLARQRDSLRPFRLLLAELQVRVDAADDKVPFRQVRKQLERACEVTTKNRAIDGRYADWHYRFQLLHAHLAYRHAGEVPMALGRLWHLGVLANARGDVGMWVVAKVQEAKLVLEQAQWVHAGELLAEVINCVELPYEPEQAVAEGTSQVQVGRLLRMHIMLLLCIQLLAVGECQRAKFWLRMVREALDGDGIEEGEQEGTFQVLVHQPTHSGLHRLIQLTPGKPSSPMSGAMEINSPLPKPEASEDVHARPLMVLLKGMPHELMYTLTYLVGTAVHLDGHGKVPKALLYVSEGLKQIDRQLTCGLSQLGSSVGPGLHGVGWLRSASGVAFGMKIEACLMASQLAIVRSEFGQADELLVEVTRLVQAKGCWEQDWARIAFLKAMLSHATGNKAGAQQGLLAMLFGAPASELGVLAKACYMLVRLADKEHEVDGEEVVQMERLTREVEAQAGQALPHENMACQVVLAMSCGEIVRAKHHLTVALNLANQTSNTHLKTILLGLLSNLFLNTRSEEAFKMLHSCAKLAAGFGGHGVSGFDGGGGGGSKDGGLASSISKDGEEKKVVAVVGQASLGLWAGKKLLEIYESQEERSTVETFSKKSYKQNLVNLAHAYVLEQIKPM